MTKRLIGFALLVVALTTSIEGCSSTVSKPQTAPTAAPSSAQTDQAVAGDISDSTVYIPVSAASGAFSVKIPQGWSQSISTPITFTDKLNSVAFSQSPASAAPTTASVTASLVPILKSDGHHFTLKDVTTVTRAGGTAIRIRYSVDSAADAVTGKVARDAVEAYVFWKNGQQAVLTLTGPDTADNVDPWMTVSDSFRWTA
ncbi:lipoprotein [soil metagenome]